MIRGLTSGLLALFLSARCLAADADPLLTPGEFFPAISASDVCVPGYARRTRNVPRSQRNQVFARYNVQWRPGAYEVEHFIPLCMGGTNGLANLWPAPKKDARQKALVDNHLCREICAGRVTLEEAREREGNWREEALSLEQRRSKAEEQNQRP